MVITAASGCGALPSFAPGAADHLAAITSTAASASPAITAAAANARHAPAATSLTQASSGQSYLSILE